VGDIIHVDTVKKNTQTLIDASKEVSLEVNAEKSNYMLLSRHQNRDVLRAERFQNVAQFRYLRTTVANKNSIQEKIKKKWILAMLAITQSITPSLLVCCLGT
jgi:hypothetical protein